MACVAKGFTQCCDVTVDGCLTDSLQSPELHLLALGLLDFVQGQILNRRALEKNVVNTRVEKERFRAIVLDPLVEGLFELEERGGLGFFFWDETGLLLNHARAKRMSPVLGLFEVGQTRRTADFFTVELEIHCIKSARGSSLVDPHLSRRKSPCRVSDKIANRIRVKANAAPHLHICNAFPMNPGANRCRRNR